MKKTLKAVLIAGILVMAGGQPARAQQAERVVQFKTTFAFQVENTRLPAGEYTILEQSGWVQIQTKGGKNATHVLTMPVASKGQKTVETAQVVFHNYAGRMFLAEIWASDQEKGRELLQSKDEQQLAKQEKMATVVTPAHTVPGR